MADKLIFPILLPSSEIQDTPDCILPDLPDLPGFRLGCLPIFLGFLHRLLPYFPVLPGLLAIFPPIAPPPWFHGPQPWGAFWFCCHWLQGDGPPKFPPGPPNFPRPPGPPLMGPPLCMGPPLIGPPRPPRLWNRPPRPPSKRPLWSNRPRPPRLSNRPRGPPRVFWNRPLLAPLSLNFFIRCSCFFP